MYRHRIRALRTGVEQDNAQEADPPPGRLLHHSDQCQDLLTLLALVIGDPELAKQTDGRDDVVHEGKTARVQGSRDDVVLCLLEYQEEMVVELLIRTAIRNRLRLDAWEAERPRMDDGTKMEFGFTLIQVGDLKRGDADWSPMPLREGCNKVIHADRFEFPCTTATSYPSLTGDVETTGMRGREPWRSRINVARYVRASIYNTYGGIDFPRGWMRRS